MEMRTILMYSAAMSAVLSFDGALPAPQVTSLANVAKGQSARVVSVESGAVAGFEEIERRLCELGFLPGETVRVVARGIFGGDPIAVRIGTATFALRRFEAECIQVVVAATR